MFYLNEVRCKTELTNKAFRLYKRHMEFEIESDKVSICIDNIPELISFLKSEVYL